VLIALAAALALQGSPPDSARLRHADGRMPSTVHAVRVTRGPTVDGRLSEAIWDTAPAITGLIQSDPDEGRPVSESTEVRLVYDATALYIGARLFDRHPADIARRLARRDVSTPSDEVRILLDTYHDHRTAFQFVVTAAGGRLDGVIGDDGGYEDDSWDPVWRAATTVDSLGWTAEIRIPFSQLRFSGAAEQVWGIRVDRWIQRKNELAVFPFVRKTESGFASRFAHLLGLRDIVAHRSTELLPYALTRGRFHRPDRPGNPFDDGRTEVHGAGLDLKASATPTLTLDLTVNPDFGQVELDPAFVNLTEFEQFLDEHRPFFVEGSDIFRFGSTGGGLNRFSDPPLYFYSRRIGRPPQGKTTSHGQFKSVPENTTILGAAKLSGKTANGWSVGLLEGLTAREYGIVADTLTGVRRADEVEPLSSYFAGRIKRDLHGGATTVGFLTTATQRDLDRPTLDFLNSAAYVGALDFTHRWKNRTYSLAGSLGSSYIRGDPTAITAAQRSSARYFQRPDARHSRYDPQRTSLAGMAGDLYLNKVQGNWVWGVAGSAASPGFEVNDLGFKKRVDQVSAAAAGGRRWTVPGKVFRQADARLSAKTDWNFDGDVIRRSLGLYGFGRFRNFWAADVNVTYDGWVFDDRLTRGGPLARKPAAWSAAGEAYTDDRKAVSAYAYLSYVDDAAGGWYLTTLPQVTYRPSKALSASLSVGYEVGRDAAQYVQRVVDSTATAMLGVRYVFAALDERSAYLKLRINAAFSRTASLQVFAQPFTFVADYSGFKELAATRSFAFARYGKDRGSTIVADGSDYTVDPDGAGPAGPFRLANPDFRSRSFRLTAVWRWEYRPGSTLFLVWTQTRSGDLSDVAVGLAPDLRRAVFFDRPTNVLMLKVNYWLRQ
jgi:hypothetical protein